jgi:hypothetical protein
VAHVASERLASSDLLPVWLPNAKLFILKEHGVAVFELRRCRHVLELFWGLRMVGRRERTV